MTALLVLGLIAGLALLTVASDQFVLGAARVAVVLRLSAVVIGAVVIGFGTSAPEMLVSGIAAAQGSLDISVGNVIGSNVANLSLVLGVATLVAPITVASATLRREAPLSLGAVILFAIVVQSGLSRTEGIVLGVLLVVALTVLLASARRGGDAELAAEVDEYLADGPPDPRREWVRTLLGLVGTLGAAQLLVFCATGLAAEIGLEEGFVGLTIVAIGTSLPELATSLQAVRKEETDLIVGNLLGSNLFNSFGVGAVAALAGPGPVNDTGLTTLGVALMVGVAVATTVFMVTGARVVRTEGILLLITYMAVVPLLA